MPGMARKLALNSYVVDADSIDHLKDIGTSSDAAHYYNIVIDEGRSVVTHIASSKRNIG